MSSMLVNSLLTKKVRSRPGTTDTSFGSSSSWNMYAILALLISSSPKFLASDPRAFGHGMQLRPHDRGVNAPVQLLLREAAICAGDEVLAADQPGESEEALGD